MLKMLSFALFFSAISVVSGCAGPTDRVAESSAVEPTSTLGYPESHLMMPMIAPALGSIF
jgi:hypothetical protein